MRSQEDAWREHCMRQRLGPADEAFAIQCIQLAVAAKEREFAATLLTAMRDYPHLELLPPFAAALKAMKR